MRRFALVGLVGAPLLAGVFYVGCSKSAGTKEKPDDTLGGGGKIDVPGAKGGPTVGGGAPDTGPGKATDERQRLTPDEGQLAIEAPAGAKVGSEAIAKVVAKPGKAYK